MQSKEVKADIQAMFDGLYSLQSNNLARLNDNGKLREVCSEILNIKNSLFHIAKCYGLSDKFLKSVDPALKAKLRLGRRLLLEKSLF